MTKQLRELYPPIELNKHGFLTVGDGFDLYWEECGNPHGTPIIFLHGGPGSCIEPSHRQFFDPKKYRIILLDQRGAGKSKPHAKLEGNNTWNLVADIEKLRELLGIKSWVVFGGSWGSTLSLCYAIKHPTCVRALVLRGIFLCRKKELHWFYQFGAHHLFPDEWERYIEIIPAAERDDLIAAYYRRLTSDNKSIRLTAARAWSRWEGATIRLIPDAEVLARFTADHHAVAIARIECHYFMNKAFLDTDNWIIENAGALKNIPTTIVHGRYDVVCPIENAWELKKVMPHADFHIVHDAGHSAFEPGIADALVRATDGDTGIR
jgi:proline iminopeptidase